ncbi:MAG: endonuclease domain-containing protein [Rhizomicrobium sp.]
MTRFDRTKVKTIRARRLRHEATRPEQKLWFHLRGAQIGGFSFRRQHPVGPYVLDFYCSAAKLAIELDGDQHGTKEALAYDAARTRFLSSKRIRVIRFANYELKDNLDGVIEGISRALASTPTRPATPGDLPLSGEVIINNHPS